MGGKTRIAKQLAAEIDKVRRPGQWVWDAFCGGLSMSVALSKNGPVYSTDACVPLIALYRAVQAGWDPPTHVDEATYRAARDLPDTDPMKAFCGFGGSFGGKWFGGYIPSVRSHTVSRGSAQGHTCTNRAYAACGEVIRRDTRYANIDCVDFLKVAPRPVDGVLYLDPPYAGTTGYAATGPFASERFVERVRAWSAFAPVFVSEYEFPFGVCVWSRELRTGLNGAANGPVRMTERLYYIAKDSLQ